MMVLKQTLILDIMNVLSMRTLLKIRMSQQEKFIGLYYKKERRGDFGGGTVQVIPHITNEIKSRFYRNPAATDTEIAIIEVGGTVGDIESQPFLESIRQFQHEKGAENVILIHVTLIPYLRASQEMKQSQLRQA